MKILKENILEIILLIGIVFISIGFLMLSIPFGFIITGALIIYLVCKFWKENTKGVD